MATTATSQDVDQAALPSPRKDVMVSNYAEISSPVKPSAPPADWPSEQQCDQRKAHADAAVVTPPGAWPAIEPPELLPPSARAKRGLAWLTLKLVPYHALNFALGVGAFCVVVTGVSVAGALLPLCCLGVPIYFLLLQLTRMMVVMDIALANTITRSQAAARSIAPDTIDEADASSAAACGYELRIAPKLTRISWRSTLVLLYFGTVKFALGIASCVVVCMPFTPLAAEIVSHTASPDEPTYVAGWNVHKFNFSTHPVWFVVVFIVYVVVGVALMHFLGLLSRETTRRVCCVEAVVVAPPLGGPGAPMEV